MRDRVARAEAEAASMREALEACAETERLRHADMATLLSTLDECEEIERAMQAEARMLRDEVTRSEETARTQQEEAAALRSELERCVVAERTRQEESALLQRSVAVAERERHLLEKGAGACCCAARAPSLSYRTSHTLDHHRTCSRPPLTTPRCHRPSFARSGCRSGRGGQGGATCGGHELRDCDAGRGASARGPTRVCARRPRRGAAGPCRHTGVARL